MKFWIILAIVFALSTVLSQVNRNSLIIFHGGIRGTFSIFQNNLILSSLRPRPHVSGYFRIRNFFFPDTATVHTHPANSTANLEKNKSALQSGKKNKSATNPITCGRVNPEIFESDDVKSVSSLSPNIKPIWRNNEFGEQSKFSTTAISLYGACSEDNLVQRSLGY